MRIARSAESRPAPRHEQRQGPVRAASPPPPPPPPQPRPTPRQEARPGPTEAPRRAEAHDGAEHRQGRPEAQHGGEHAHGDGGHATATAADAGSGTIDYTGADTVFQQEVAALKGEVSTLVWAGVFNRATAPKSAGTWGIMYQRLMVGVTLTEAFANLNHATAAIRDGFFHSAALVRNHKTMTFVAKKGR